MPAISGPFGPIVEPGWPSTLPGQPDLIGAFQSAAALRASTNAKQQEFQAQMAHYALMEHSSKYDRELAWKKYELDKRQVDLNYDAKLRGYEVATTRAETEAQRVKNTLEDKERDDKRKEDWHNQQIEGKQVLVDADTELNRRKLHPGDPGYQEAWDELTQRARALLPNQTFNILAKERYDEHTKNAVAAWSQFHQLESSYTKDRQNTLYGGSLEGGDDPLLYPDKLKPEMAGGSYLPWRYDQPTGRVLVPQPGGAPDRPVATSELARLNKMRTDLQQKKTRLPTTQNRPEVGSFDVGKEPAPVDEAMREDTKVYLTPDGNPHRWSKPPGATKGQWIDP